MTIMMRRGTVPEKDTIEVNSPTVLLLIEYKYSPYIHTQSFQNSESK